MNITEQEIKELSDFAKINLDKKEIKRLKTDLNKIIKSFTVLDQVDISDISPLININDIKNILRDDIVENNNHEENQAFALKNAPNKKDGFVVVPKIIE